MRYVGIDVHKGFPRVESFDPATGEVQDHGSAPTRWELLCGGVGQMEGEKTVVLEAGRTSHFLAAKLERAASRVWIVDPAAPRTVLRRFPAGGQRR